MCGRRRPNERFGGSGYRRVFCKECRKRPDFKQRRALDELESYLFGQSNISKKNLKRLRELKASDDERIREMAQLVYDVAQVKPQRRKRVGFLKHNHPEIFERFAKVACIDTAEHDYDDEWDFAVAEYEQTDDWVEEDHFDEMFDQIPF